MNESKKMRTHADAIVDFFALCHRAGVHSFVACAGARNAPFVLALEYWEHAFEVHSAVDERSAAFWALGQARKTEAPVVVCVTSGTAVAECLPAMIEAHYSGAKLWILSADRPLRLRYTGAPQAMPQSELFSPFCEQIIDEDLLADWYQRFESPHRLDSWDRVHWNFRLDEPLLDDARFRRQKNSNDSASIQDVSTSRTHKLITTEPLPGPRPLVIVSTLLESSHQGVRKLLESFPRVPIFMEGPSGLSMGPAPGACIAIGDPTLAVATATSVIRIGGIPIHRVWRDLDQKFSDLPVLHYSDQSYVGLARGEVQPLSKIAELVSDMSSRSVDADWVTSIQAANDSWLMSLSQLIRDFPEAEESMVYEWMCRKLGLHASEALLVSAPKISIAPPVGIYLGNSLPVRHWDFLSGVLNHKHSPTFQASVWANRGMNGIDGQIASFFGISAGDPSQPIHALMGDLTVAYDVGALLHSTPATGSSLTIIDNAGGQIFGRLFDSKLLVNRPKINWDRLIEALGHESWMQVLHPCATETFHFHQQSVRALRKAQSIVDGGRS